MAAKCLNCGYVMNTWQEVTTLLWKLLFGRGGNQSVLAGPLNVEKVACPKCKAKGQWEDC